MAQNTTDRSMEKTGSSGKHSTESSKYVSAPPIDNLSPVSSACLGEGIEEFDSEGEQYTTSEVDETSKNKCPSDEKDLQSTFNTIRVTRADLEKLKNNTDMKDIPETLEGTTSLIESFIQKKRSNARKRKHDDGLGEINDSKKVLESLQLKPEIETNLGTSNDDFRLLIYHSKTVSSSKGQQFTKTLVTDEDGRKIVTDKPSSSLIYFFYRILDRDSEPEIFVLTVGHTWRIAKEIACESYTSKMERLLEDKTLHQKLIHLGEGAVFCTEQYARGGKKLDLSEMDMPDTIVSRSTRFPNKGSTLNEQEAFKRNSRVYVSNTEISFTINLNILLIIKFFKYISAEIQTGPSKRHTNLQKLQDKQIKKSLDKKLLNDLKRLTDKDENGEYQYENKYLQHEDSSRWNEKTKLTLLESDKVLKPWKDKVPTFRDVIEELNSHNISEEDWLDNVRIKWDKHNYPLHEFLEDYIILDGIFYKYLFGQWYTITKEYISKRDEEFKQFLRQNYLEASKDFPILPWIHVKNTISKQKKESSNDDEEEAYTNASHSASATPGGSGRQIDLNLDSPGSFVTTIDLGRLPKNTYEAKDYETFLTETFEKSNASEMIHYPIKVYFDKMLEDKPTECHKSKMKARYSVCKRKKVSSQSYFIPKPGCNATKAELANLIFLRMSTPATEGEYNDLHMLLRRLLEIYKRDNRFIIIPGDECFVVGKNIELYDILISDEKEKVTYIIHVKEGFGQKTRDVCSQLRLSAQTVRDSILFSASSSALEQYWKNNTDCLFNKKDYRKEVAQILNNMGKKKFLEMFMDETRRLVFVYACRDSRKWKGLQQDAETPNDFSSSAEEDIRNILCKKCCLTQGTINLIIDKLKEKNVLAPSGQISDEYMYKNTDSVRGIIQEINLGLSQNVVDCIKKSVLENRLSNSDSYIAKWELLILKDQFSKYATGNRKFELKICQIPMAFYLKNSTDSLEEGETNNSESDIDDPQDEDDNGEIRSHLLAKPQALKNRLIPDYFSVLPKTASNTQP